MTTKKTDRPALTADDRTVYTLLKAAHSPDHDSHVIHRLAALFMDLAMEATCAEDDEMGADLDDRAIALEATADALTRVAEALDEREYDEACPTCGDDSPAPHVCPDCARTDDP